MTTGYKGPDRRQFIRLDYVVPLAYKVCKEETISKLLSGYTQDVSPAGLQCKLDKQVPKDSILWLSFDTDTLTLCEELEKRSVIVQKGILGKAVWIKQNKDGSFYVGVQFITREEKSNYDKYCDIR